MATKKTNNSLKKAVKKTAKKTVKSAKKGNKGAIAVVIFVLILIVAGACTFAILYGTGKLDGLFGKKPQTTTTVTTTTQSSQTGPVVHGDDGITENVKYDNFQIHFLELGNKYAGDSTYIKAGDTDILIDAGSRKGSAETIKAYVDQFCTDGKLEYVIATHAHQDHIAGFVGTGSAGNKNGILYKYQIGTFIDFALSDVTSALYTTEYKDAVDYAVAHGATHNKVNTYFDASHNPKDSATITLAEGITMDILYNKFYFEASGDENNYSVCTMFNYNDKHYLLTGDLEKEGEESIAAYYDGSTPKKTLPHVELFKAGHHGSKTSSNECLLEKICPKMCVACSCAGSTEYTLNNDTIFPTQDFINRIAKYTSRVYVTTVFDRETKTFKSLNGNVVVSSDGTNVGLTAKDLTRLKDTTWFNETIYVVDGKVASGSKGSEEFYTKDSPGAVAIPQRTWPANGVQ